MNTQSDDLRFFSQRRPTDAFKFIAGDPFCVRKFGYSWFTLYPVACWESGQSHDDVIKWKHFPRDLPFMRGIHRSPVNSPHKGEWRWALMFSLICVWINDWVNSRQAGDLRHHRAHYDVTLMHLNRWWSFINWTIRNTFAWNSKQTTTFMQ